MTDRAERFNERGHFIGARMENLKELRLAVLIDAENIPYSNVKGMIDEISKYGTPTFKRVYGDWQKPMLSGWKSALLENAITPIQQYSYTSGKNATDSALIIDAMDILYTGRVDGFCLISSDSDFTRLAIRLREAGMKVYGIGVRNTPLALIAAYCDFIYLESLSERKLAVAPVVSSQGETCPETEMFVPATKQASKKKKKDISAGVEFSVSISPDELDRSLADSSIKMPESKKTTEYLTPAPLKKVDDRTVHLIESSVLNLAGENGWAFLGPVGGLILKKQPDFDPRNYGFRKLAQLIKSMPQFEIAENAVRVAITQTPSLLTQV